MLTHRESFAISLANGTQFIASLRLPVSLIAISISISYRKITAQISYISETMSKSNGLFASTDPSIHDKNALDLLLSNSVDITVKCESLPSIVMSDKCIVCHLRNSWVCCAVVFDFVSRLLADFKCVAIKSTTGWKLRELRGRERALGSFLNDHPVLRKKRAARLSNLVKLHISAQSSHWVVSRHFKNGK